MRFETTSGWMVSSTEYKVPFDGRSISTQAGVVVSIRAGGGPSAGAGVGGAGTVWALADAAAPSNSSPHNFVDKCAQATDRKVYLARSHCRVTRSSIG